MFICEQFESSWNEDQAETQFQGMGSSHELAAVLLTECLQFSRYSLKKPVYVLYLDAKSAFDVVRKEPLLRNLFFLNKGPDILLSHINNRVSHRQTVLDWDTNLMGPIHDELGLEQGGVNSSDFYKIFGKEQLELAQKSELGVKMKNLTISAIGQADDTVLISNSISALRFLLVLTLHFCNRYKVQLSAEKTKLQVYNLPSNDQSLHYNPIKINEIPVPFVHQAEHVGILRSTNGNCPTILDRFSAHKRALWSVMHTGLARGHRANPAVTIKIERMYAVPVLLSGLAALVLSKKEVDMIDHHFMETIRQLLRLHKNTPRCAVFFLAGTLPGIALLHLRQLSLFNMICRLPDNVLHKHALNWFTSVVNFKGSWLQQIRDICLMYNLPHPSVLLKSTMDKNAFKKLSKKHVISYWEQVLRAEAVSLKSLSYFKPSHMSLVAPHPIWKTAGNSPYKVAMATVQAVMVSGRYRCGALTRHWGTSSGFCTLSPICVSTMDDLDHIIKVCPALHTVRSSLLQFTTNYASTLPLNISELLLKKCNILSPTFTNIILDCSVDPDVILTCQDVGFHVLDVLFMVTRSWAYVLHRERLKLLGRWRCSFN